MTLRLMLVCFVTCAWWFQPHHAVAGPPGDYGDAPVGNTGDGINAYAGVTSRFATRFNHTSTVFSPIHPHGAWLNAGGTGRLGTVGPSVKVDSAMTPGPPENDGAPVILIWPDAPPGPNPLCSVEVTVTTSAGHDASQPLYLNLWVDQNRDGQWKDGYSVATPLISWNLEWVAQDVAVMIPAGTTARVSVATIRLEDPLNTHWVRVMVTNEPVGSAFRGPSGTLSNLWDSTMTGAHAFRGEIEDHLLNFRTDDPGATPSPGVWYYRQYKRRQPPGGGPPAKPACILTYAGPWLLYPPRCPGVLISTLRYSSISINGGCDRAPALWGMYGLKHIAGVLGPPVVNLRFPLPAGAVAGVVAFACPAPFVNVLGLAPFVAGEGPMMASAQVPVRRLTDPPSLQIDSCYPRPPRRFRVYRAFFHHDTCGSLHVNRSVHTHPASGMTLAAIISDGPGAPADYCDFATGGLEETIEDPEEARPFPDPDFADALVTLLTPTGSVTTEADEFVSAPKSLAIRGAAYRVRPAIPEGYQASRMLIAHRGASSTLVLTAHDGGTLVTTLPPADDWGTVVIEVAPGFDLDTFEVFSPGLLLVDDMRIALRPEAPCREFACVDWTRDASGGSDAHYDIEFFNPGSDPFLPPLPWPSITWQLWRGPEHPLLVNEEDATLWWQPLSDGLVLPGGTQVLITPSGDLSLLNLAVGDFIHREIRVRPAPLTPCSTPDAFSMSTRLTGCNLADITELGGTLESPGNPDDQLTVDDLILFVNLFSDGAGCPGDSPCNFADVCGIGGPPEEPDGQLTVDDLIAFVNAFSEGC